MSFLSRAARVARQLLASASSPTPVERAPDVPAARAADGTVTEHRGPLPPLRYAPQPDDDADPGEVVWAWVPYDENDGRGKDRPVLVIARVPGGYLGLQLTSKDHDRDGASAAAEERSGRRWLDVGSGGWDSHGRESEVRLDRPLHLPAGAVRREGAALDRARFEQVVAALAEPDVRG